MLILDDHEIFRRNFNYPTYRMILDFNKDLMPYFTAYDIPEKYETESYIGFRTIIKHFPKKNWKKIILPIIIKYQNYLFVKIKLDNIIDISSNNNDECDQIIEIKFTKKTHTQTLLEKHSLFINAFINAFEYLTHIFTILMFIFIMFLCLMKINYLMNSIFGIIFSVAYLILFGIIMLLMYQRTNMISYLDIIIRPIRCIFN